MGVSYSALEEQARQMPLTASPWQVGLEWDQMLPLVTGFFGFFFFCKFIGFKRSGSLVVKVLQTSKILLRKMKTQL